MEEFKLEGSQFGLAGAQEKLKCMSYANLYSQQIESCNLKAIWFDF